MVELTPSHVGVLQAIVGMDYLRFDAASRQKYGGDRTSAFRIDPSAVVLPASIAEVQQIVEFACREQVSIVPSGGRTGLSGGAVAANSELVLALDRLDTISRFSSVDRTVVCGGGVITQNLQKFAEEQGLHYPVEFASSGSSQVGGNLATNAGGIHVLRYGMTRQWVAGMKLVTGTGELLDLNRGLRKNNTGYDLLQLAIGSEGTLGVIVEATVRLTDPPGERDVMVLGAPDMDAILAILAKFQNEVALSAFEFFTEPALGKVLQSARLQRPFESASPYYALLEIDAGTAELKESALSIFEDCLESGLVSAGVRSTSSAQARALWRLREDISESIARFSPYKNDISTTVSALPQFLAEVDHAAQELEPEMEIIWFGHIGDGNVHLNVLKPGSMSQSAFDRHCEELGERVYARVQQYGGSVAAEHGVGLLKKKVLHYSRSEQEIGIMRGIKSVFDPAGIMNPGKIFDS